VEDGKTGIVVDPPDDVAQTAAAIARLIADPELRRRMGEAARVRATVEFSYDVLARRLGESLGAYS
jgi:phosphatidylinositol alpha-1,6-mannosyltransferase